MAQNWLQSLSLAVGILAVGSSVRAQGVGAPVAGYVFNPGTSGLHPIVGLLGAATLGLPILKGVQAASYSPETDVAVVSRLDGVFAVSGVRSDSPQYLALSDSAGPFLVGWGKSSAIVCISGAFQLLSGLGGSLSLAVLPVGLPAGEVRALDYDEAGQRVSIALASAERNAGLYGFSMGDGELQRLASVGKPVSVARLGSRVFVLDGMTSAIWGVGQDGVAAHLAVPFDAKSQFVAIAGSADEQRLYVVDVGLQQVDVFDSAGVSLGQIPVGGAAERLDRLGNGGVFELNSQVDQPVWLLNDSLTPAVYFIPPFKVAVSVEKGRSE